ncbi:hypothetical protein RCC89_19520 [Cytophagaceae bacterium ABcell3]|nr:hypothetical protein RCC89_19520 [Cytophagaceae bacterium ABcell3]
MTSSQGVFYKNLPPYTGMAVPVTASPERLLEVAPIGSRVAISTAGEIDDEAWRNENVVKVGPDQYSAHPFGIVSFQQLLETAAPHSTKPYFLKQVEFSTFKR